MEEELCRCCGKQPAMSAAMLEQLSKIAWPRQFMLTKDLQQKLPPQVLENLKQMEQRLPAYSSQMSFKRRVGFCAMCGRATCDGIASCRVPLKQWLRVEQHTAMKRALGQANDLERRWLAGELGRNEKWQVGEWVRITEAYWRMEMNSVYGTLIAEAIHDTERGFWLARVKFAEEPMPINTSTVTVYQSAGATVLLDLESLEAAQAACSQTIEEISSDGSGLSLDIRVESESVVDDM